MSPLSLELYNALLAQPKNLILIQRSATPSSNNHSFHYKFILKYNSLRFIFIIKYNSFRFVYLVKHGQGFGILFRSVKFSMLLKFNKCSITRSLNYDCF